MGMVQATCGFEDDGCCPPKDRHVGKAAMDQTLDELIDKLFRLQDLNGDGFLDEMELVQLNKKVAILHYGKDIDKEQVKAKYQDIFRSMLDAGGGLVSYDAFRKHTLSVLMSKDRDKLAQSFILEQWISEAASARLSFSIPSMQSISDVPFLLLDSFDVDPSRTCDESNIVRTPPVARSAHDEHEFADKPQVEFGNLVAPPDTSLEGVGRSEEAAHGMPVPRAPAPSEAASSGLSRGDVACNGPVAVQVTVSVHDSCTMPS